MNSNKNLYIILGVVIFSMFVNTCSQSKQNKLIKESISEIKTELKAIKSDNKDAYSIINGKFSDVQKCLIECEYSIVRSISDVNYTKNQMNILQKQVLQTNKMLSDTTKTKTK